MKNECKRCGYKWEGKQNAKSCPKCKRYDWNDDKDKKMNNQTVIIAGGDRLPSS